ncbi:S28 family serine protease [Fluoribacter dumoffii]|uniref:Prolyl tri/tetrapeptidyl aminopeptidase n=1 Tax=Fluoribacter dumoffii TaxID=463 RepID=A0A377G586_9GAMM|nr:S28 family serine protease [Fluoribacter dumoffii]KTC91507.1 serine carboxypeptidase [Fluoribacter dumoffii NY 23]MCW8387369.1 S28 family serine protease [Fluoribacter dumoffii]MCW8417124.1 S28 family serine protease [Fluoribacter dumoffii]MCW8455036.1 S28 family serine protease [Fluoribacter dumoffii]MCW8460887.1 S28 family serine protease [Fluoribacter dumoffii]
MIIKCITLFFLSLYAFFSPAQAGMIERYLQKINEEKTPLLAEQTIKLGYFKQLIDHNNPGTGNFYQRYYIDESYGPEMDAPVFFYICGEAACSKRALNGAIRNYAQKFHAKLVALEHRYYGDSLPFNTLSTEHLRFLTTEAALDDLAAFQRHLKNERNWNGKWVAFGGSYPGSLSAYYRLKFPYLVVGALASSAPVMAKEDFIEYDAHVTQVAGLKCAAQMREAVNEVEASLSDAAKWKEMKELFEASAVDDPVDFLYLIADTGAAAVQYGMRDEFCTRLATSPTPLQGYAEFAKNLYKAMHINAVEMTAQGAMSENPAAYKDGLGMRQWYYQSCKEYGYWQNAHPNPAFSTRSSLINLDYHHKICERLFGLTQPVNTEEINNTLYIPLMDTLTSNIYFTNGENDPWSTLSLAEKNGNAINPKLTYHLIQGAAHCDDLHSPSAIDSDSLREARKTMEILLANWLKKD